MSTPKLHHYVPQAYLARFGQGEQVRVRRRLPPKTHLAKVKNIAAETGFYAITDEAGASSTVIEHALGELEGQGLLALRRIDETASPSRIRGPRASLPLPGCADDQDTTEAHHAPVHPQRH